MAVRIAPNGLLKLPASQRALLAACASPASSARLFSVLNRPPPNYEGHVPLTTIERAALGLSSAIGSLVNVRRHDLVAATGEATATPYFIYRLRDAMLRNSTGRRILRDRPRITSKTMSLEYLRTLPDGSVGRTYAAWLDREGVTPDTRDAVRYIDDEECAYVMQRYRECHDFYHAVTGLPVFTEGELALKAFEFANTLLPMTGLALGAAVRLKPAERRRFFGIGTADHAPGGYLGWALSNGLKSEEVINVYWEEELSTPVADLQARLGITAPPDLRAARKAARDARRAEKAALQTPDAAPAQQ